jgi:hypothetical protein
MVHSNLPASNPARRKKKKANNIPMGEPLSLVGLDSQQKSRLQHDSAPFEDSKIPPNVPTRISD